MRRNGSRVLSAHMYGLVLTVACSIQSCDVDDFEAAVHIPPSDCKLADVGGYVSNIGFVYTCRKGEGYYVAAGTNVMGPYEDNPTLALSANRRGYAFIAKKNKASVLNHNGRESPSRCVGNLALSEDGAQVACAVGKTTAITIARGRAVRGLCAAEEAAVSKNGKIGAARYDQVCDVVVTSTGAVAYTASRDDVWRVVLNGTEIGSGYQAVDGLTVCGGTHLVYLALRDEHIRVVVDGKPGAPLIGIQGFACSGRSVAYWGTTDDESLVLVHNGSTQTKDYDSVSAISLSQDGNHIAYRANKGLDQYYVLDGMRSRVFVDGVEQKSGQFPNVTPILSRDGGSILLLAPRNGETAVVVDGKVISEFDQIVSAKPVNGSVVVVGTRGDQVEVDVADKPMGQYHELRDLVVNDTGTEFAFVTREGNRLLRVVKQKGLLGW